MIKCKVTTTRNIHKVVFDKITTGELLALENALKAYAIKSTVGSDVNMYLQNGIEANNKKGNV